MLDRKYRLPAAARLKSPIIINTSSFLVKIAKNGLLNSRFGFVVRKKTDKRATVRNRIRRLLRSCIEERLEQIKYGYDMLFFLEKGIIETERETLCLEVEKVFKDRSLLI